MQQTCVTANRIFVHETILDEFVSRFASTMDAELKVGRGLEKGINQGPIINQRQFDRVSNRLSLHRLKNQIKIIHTNKCACDLPTNSIVI